MAWLFSDSGAGPQAIRPLYETYIISVEHTLWVVSVLARLDVKIKKEFVTSHAKTFRTVSRFKTDSPSPAVHLPFERLVLSVLKNSSSVRTVWAIRSRKLISRSNGPSYPFEKNHQPFELLELSVREIHQPFEWLKWLVLKHGTPERWSAGAPERRNAGTPERRNIETRNTETRNTKLLKPGTYEKQIIKK